jgi:hypothetical protein
MNMWFWKSKGQKERSLDEKIKSLMSGKKYGRLPVDINKLDDSYRMLIKELAKR